jgi:type IV pilus assembly protein PilO
MKKNSGFDNFIDNKFIPLDRKFKLIIGVVLLILPIVAYYFVLYQPKSKEIQGLLVQKDKLTQELQKAKATARNLGKHKAEVAKAKKRFEEIASILPKEKEIPKLLTNISALGRGAGLEFVTFKPQRDVRKDYYDEIPVQIKLTGPYHNTGSFLDQVSKLDRLVSVSNIKMGGPKLVEGEMLLNSSCRLVTYRFTNKPLPKDNTKGKRRRR